MRCDRIRRAFESRARIVPAGAGAGDSPRSSDVVAPGCRHRFAVVPKQRRWPCPPGTWECSRKAASRSDCLAGKPCSSRRDRNIEVDPRIGGVGRVQASGAPHRRRCQWTYGRGVEVAHEPRVAEIGRMKQDHHHDHGNIGEHGRPAAENTNDEREDLVVG